MKKDLEEYFGTNWITKEQCAELIKMAAKNKPNGNNFSETKALFNQFKQAADKEAERLRVLEKRLDDTSELIAPLKESILEYYKRLLDKKETLKTDADEFSKLVINFLPSVSSITDLTIIQTRIQAFIDQLRQNSFFKTVKDEAFIQAVNRVNSLLEIKLTNDEAKNILKSRLDASMKELKKATETAKNNVIKAFVNSDLVEQIKTASEEVINLLTSYENLIKENKAKLISNEAFVESFENAIKDLVAFITRNTQNKSFEEELNETVNENADRTTDTYNDSNTTDETERTVSAYNEDSYQPDNKETGTANTTANGNIEEESSRKETRSGTDDLTGATSEDRNLKHEGHLYGNIGVTKSTDMLLDEIGIRRQQNILDIVSEMLFKEVCIYTY